MPDVDCTILWYVVVLLLIVSIIYFTFIYIILNIRSRFGFRSCIYSSANPTCLGNCICT